MSNTEELQSKISLLEEKVKNLEKGQFKSITTRRINIVDLDEVDDYYDYDDPEYFDTTNDLDKDFGLFMYSKENDLLYSHGFLSFPGERLDDDDTDMSVVDEDYEDGDAETTHITTNYYHLDDDNKQYNKRPRISVGQCSHGAGQIRLSNHKANQMVYLGTIRRCHSGRINVFSGDHENESNNRSINLSTGNHYSHPVSQEETYSSHGITIFATRKGEDGKMIMFEVQSNKKYDINNEVIIKVHDENKSWSPRLDEDY